MENTGYRNRIDPNLFFYLIICCYIARCYVKKQHVRLEGGGGGRKKYKPTKWGEQNRSVFFFIVKFILRSVLPLPPPPLTIHFKTPLDDPTLFHTYWNWGKEGFTHIKRGRVSQDQLRREKAFNKISDLLFRLCPPPPRTSCVRASMQMQLLWKWTIVLDSSQRTNRNSI